MSSNDLPVLNSQELKALRKIYLATKYFVDSIIICGSSNRKLDKKRAKAICKMIQWEEQKMLNTYQGISWLYRRNLGGQYGRRNNFI